MNLKDYIDAIPDFPEKGILYRDIQPLLADPKAFQLAVEKLAGLITCTPDYIIGIDSRGFIFATAIAMHLGCGIKLIRKKGKLPNKELVSASYNLEYGTDTLEMNRMGNQEKVVLVDDVLATGGTIKAAEELVIKAGYYLKDTICLIDIGIVSDTHIKSVIKYV